MVSLPKARGHKNDNFEANKSDSIAIKAMARDIRDSASDNKGQSVPKKSGQNATRPKASDNNDNVKDNGNKQNADNCCGVGLPHDDMCIFLIILMT